MAGNTRTGTTGFHREGTVNVDGCQITYAEYGSPDGAPVLFLHGTPGSRRLARIFDEQATENAIRVIAPDRPGIGHSEPAPEYGLRDWSRDVALFVDALELDSFGVVGFSGGGPHALAVGAGIHDGHLPRHIFSGIGLLAGASPPEAPQASVKYSNRLLGVAVRSVPRVAAWLFAVGAWIANRRPPATSRYADLTPHDTAQLLKQ